MQRTLAISRGLIDAALMATLGYWMLLFGVFGLWNVGATPGWCIAYFVGLGVHAFLLRPATRTRASLEAWAIAGLASVPVINWMAREGVPFAIDRVGGWNMVLDGGEVNWILWPCVHLLLWWPAWQVTRSIGWPRRSTRREGVPR